MRLRWLVWIGLQLAAVGWPSEGAAGYGMVIKGGHVIDPRQGIDGVADVAISGGKVAAVGQGLAADSTGVTVDATGLYVAPGLIDLHEHVFQGAQQGQGYYQDPKDGDIWWGIGNSYGSVPADAFSFRSGVTTVVDAGSSGWRTLREFRTQAVRSSQTRVLAFVNILGAGMQGGAGEQSLSDMEPRTTAYAAAEHKDIIVGVKLAHYEGVDWEPLRRAIEAGSQAGVPVMVDFGSADPPMPLARLLDALRPGDILTHCYARVEGRESVVDTAGVLRPEVLRAQQRGIVFDVGHGGGSFVYRQAVPATRQGFWPNTISTDLHAYCMNSGVQDLSSVMSKFLSLGMPLRDVIAAVRWTPAQVLKRPALGSLAVGAEADVVVFRVLEGSFGFVDTEGRRMAGSRKLVTELTLRAGEVAWDLNGLAAAPWGD